MRARIACAVGALLAGCSLFSSVDDLEGQSATDSGTDSNGCQAKVDCSACGNCQDSCVCVGASDLVACITSCEADGGAGSGGSGGSGGAAGSAGSAAADAGGDGGSGGVVSTPGTIMCGTTKCLLPDEHCCFTPVKSECLADVAQCDATVIQCDGPEDCPGQICCGDFDFQTNTYTFVGCRATCDYKATQRILCGADPSVCPADATCQASEHLPGYVTCDVYP